jgi:hypothetical protein
MPNDWSIASAFNALDHYASDNSLKMDNCKLIVERPKGASGAPQN